ncbi:SixA phosphatase family protein [Leptolyngbya sp. 7M]|uniref:SixA phosphatase family protein n=1 Tax=Leptolyngbya sp. 7M TaxID=2812896 RepID=UPI001B8D6763|nr:histidine phosphatase family protein [Leptolyngbya sp. 7M]QYO65857.1 histidine phosphatase family protein [Leptolyngbya sp. 7M]
MKQLFLLRHAKSSWEDAALSDFDRPLNERGLNTAPFMGEQMAARRFAPDLIISSPANRAAQTAKLVKESGGFNADLQYSDKIYEANPFTIRNVVSEVTSAVDSLLLVGHNPGLEGTIALLTGAQERMPTAALAVIELDINDWAEINTVEGRLLEIIRPKELMNMHRTSAK